MKMCNPNMGMGMDTVHALLNVHVYIKVSLGFLPILQWSSSNETVWKSSCSSSSSRSSYMGRVHLECGCCRKSMGFCNGAMLEGNGLSTVRVSSSSEELKANQCHTGLWCGWLVPVLHGIAGSKETFSSLETWWILEVFLRGVGVLKFSLPLSYPSSSNASLYSSAALRVVMKCPNKTSSDCWHSRCGIKEGIVDLFNGTTENMSFEISCPKL